MLTSEGLSILARGLGVLSPTGSMLYTSNKLGRKSSSCTNEGLRLFQTSIKHENQTACPQRVQRNSRGLHSLKKSSGTSSKDWTMI